MPGNKATPVLGQPRAQAKTREKRGPALLIAVFSGLVTTNLVTAGALYFAPEIQTLLERDNVAIYSAYERRIDSLRLEVDRLYSRQYAQAGDLNLQLHALSQQQELLAQQHDYVRDLADQARNLGIKAQPAPVPRPASAAMAARGRESPADEVATLTHSLYAMQDESRLALSAINDAATQSTQEIVQTLGDLGLQPSLPDAERAMGGPHIPAQQSALDSFSLSEEANAVADALARFQAARAAMTSAPIRQPLAGAQQTTSNFGNRRDPFTGRRAFHSGMDFSARTGTAIMAAGGGTVRAAGRNGGYGKMIEIEHGNGLVTRYGHMNEIAVSPGDRVTPGMRIGGAGSTGRSTGPHLHFEVRRNDEPIDPAKFMRVGRSLSAYF